jgi:hypothetical protein
MLLEWVDVVVAVVSAISHGFPRAIPISFIILKILSDFPLGREAGKQLPSRNTTRRE